MTTLTNGRAGSIPAHLMMYEIEDIEEARNHLRNSWEESNVARWEVYDFCALARELIPYQREDGTVDPEGRKVVGWLAHDLGVTGTSVHRYIERGREFPPMVMVNGEVKQVRDYAINIKYYDTALQVCKRLGLDPVQMVIRALDREPQIRTAGDLRKWLESDELRNDLSKPIPQWRELHNHRYTAPRSYRDVLEQVDEALAVQWEILQKKGIQPHWIDVKITCEIPGEEPLTIHKTELATA